MSETVNSAELSGQTVGQRCSTSVNSGISLPAEELASIQESLQGLRYGSVHITVHDGMIVQIDRTEKQRFRGQGNLPAKK